MRLRFWAGLVCCALLLAGHGAEAASDCAELAQRTPTTITRLRWIDTVTVLRAADTTRAAFGGISGIDYLPARGQWVMVSDDRNAHAPARHYPARIVYDERGFRSVEIGAPLPLPHAPGEVPDAEAIRLLPCTDMLAWSSEGDRAHGFHPSVRLMTPEGRSAGELAIPAEWRFDTGAPGERRGARPNLNLEGLAPTPDGSDLWLAMEAPLMEDGALPSLTAGAYTRFARLPLDGGPAEPWAYPLDPIPRPASGGQGRADNGVSEILALGNGALLVVERSGREVAADEFEFDVRLYLASPSATCTAAAGAQAHAFEKHKLLSLQELGVSRVDNIEGAAWGPRLADGRATLVLVSDDNFAAHQVTQLWLFAVEEP